MKWAWVTPLYWAGAEKGYILSECEVMVNLDKVKQITKDRGNYYTVWFIGESHQDTLMLNQDGFKSIENVIKA